MNIFKGLTDSELRMVAAIGKRQLVRDGDNLTSAGTRAADLYTIFEGRLKVLTQSGGGDTEDSATRVAGPRETVPLAAISVAQAFEERYRHTLDSLAESLKTVLKLPPNTE